jgi:hypothetical protein
VISLFHGKYVPIKLARDLEVLVNVGHVVLVVQRAGHLQPLIDRLCVPVQRCLPRRRVTPSSRSYRSAGSKRHWFASTTSAALNPNPGRHCRPLCRGEEIDFAQVSEQPLPRGRLL